MQAAFIGFQLLVCHRLAGWLPCVWIPTIRQLELELGPPQEAAKQLQHKVWRPRSSADLAAEIVEKVLLTGVQCPVAWLYLRGHLQPPVGTSPLI